GRGYGELSEKWVGSCERWRPKGARLLLSEGLLDVVECSQARARVGLPQRRLVSGWQRRLAGGGPSAGRGASRARETTMTIVIARERGRFRNPPMSQIKLRR